MRSKLAVVLGVLLSATLLPATQAMAVDCPDEDNIWVYDNSSSGYLHSEMASGDIYVRDANLDNCTGAFSVRTVHMSATDSITRQAEAGWWEDYIPGTQTKRWRLFTEGQIGATTCGVKSHQGDDLVGHTDRFKVDNVAGTNDWKYFVDFDSDGDYVPLATGDNWVCGLGRDHGRAMGEVAIHEANGGSTGAADHQSSLARTNCTSTCTWQNWQAMIPGGDYIDGWYADLNSGGQSGHEYYVRQCSSPC